MTPGPHESEAVPCVNGPPGTLVLSSPGQVVSRRGPRDYIGLGIILGLLLSLGLWVFAVRLQERSLVEARRLMDVDQFDEARRWLRSVPLRWSNSPEVNYRIGVCEHAGGNLAARSDGVGARRSPLELGHAGRTRTRTHSGG